MIADLVLIVLRFIVFGSFGVGAVLLVLGSLWSPAGGAMAVWLSNNRNRGIEVRFREAAYLSVLFLLPWVYQALVLLGRTPRRRLVVGANVAILLLWVFGPAFIWFSLMISAVVSPDIEKGTLGPSTRVVWALVAGSFGIVNVGMMIRATQRLLQYDQQVEAQVAADMEKTLKPAYLSIFKSAALGYALMVPMMIAYFILIISTWEWSF